MSPTEGMALLGGALAMLALLSGVFVLAAEAILGALVDGFTGGRKQLERAIDGDD